MLRSKKVNVIIVFFLLVSIFSSYLPVEAKKPLVHIPFDLTRDHMDSALMLGSVGLIGASFFCGIPLAVGIAALAVSTVFAFRHTYDNPNELIFHQYFWEPASHDSQYEAPVSSRESSNSSSIKNKSAEKQNKIKEYYQAVEKGDTVKMKQLSIELKGL